MLPISLRNQSRDILHVARSTHQIQYRQMSIFLLLSCSVMPNSFWPHELQHTRLSCPSLLLGVCSNSWPLSQWCHPSISSSFTSFFCPQSFPASGSFPLSKLFASHGQSIGALASVLPKNIQDWFPLGLTGLISLLTKGLSGVFFHYSLLSVTITFFRFIFH